MAKQTVNARYVLVWSDGSGMDATVYDSLEKARENMRKSYNTYPREQAGYPSDSWINGYGAYYSAYTTCVWQIIPVKVPVEGGKSNG